MKEAVTLSSLIIYFLNILTNLRNKVLKSAWKLNPNFFRKGILQMKSFHKCYVRNDVLRKFSKFTGKQHLCKSLFFNKVAVWGMCFPVSFAKFLRTPLLQNVFGWMFLIGHENVIFMTNLIFPLSPFMINFFHSCSTFLIQETASKKKIGRINLINT